MRKEDELIDNIDNIEFNENAAASLCHEEHNFGVLKSVVGKNRNAEHTTIEGKTLWILDDTYNWYINLKKSNYELYSKLMAIITAYSRRYLNRKNKQKKE